LAQMSIYKNELGEAAVYLKHLLKRIVTNSVL
jgi:hypothetical protein